LFLFSAQATIPGAGAGAAIHGRPFEAARDAPGIA
jgi:hypothetical protein